MSNTFDLLSKSEVHQITSLVKTLDESTFDYLQIELSGMKLTIGKGNAPMNGMAAVSVAAPISATAAPIMAPREVISAPVAIAPPPTAKQASAAKDDGTIAVVATTMGRFYSKPEPSAAPFVTVGAKVDADSTVGLIEVMKLFNAVGAGIRGIVTEICVEDAQFVEYGQVLLRIQPSEAGSGTAKKK
jgi:acetyl-CoA carboxylase biotin carboxyl carrier protein